MRKEINKSTNPEKTEESLDINYTGLLQTKYIQQTLWSCNYHFQTNEENAS